MEEWRSRLELLSLEDSSPRSLAKKLLSGNQPLDRLRMIARESSPNEALGLVCVFPTKQIEQVAQAIGTLPKFEADMRGTQKNTELCLVFITGVPLLARLERFSYLGTKSGSRIVFRMGSVPHPLVPSYLSA